MTTNIGIPYIVCVHDVTPVEEERILEFIATAGLVCEYWYDVEVDLPGNKNVIYLHKFFFGTEQDAMIFALRWAR